MFLQGTERRQTDRRPLLPLRVHLAIARLSAACRHLPPSAITAKQLLDHSQLSAQRNMESFTVGGCPESGGERKVSRTEMSLGQCVTLHDITSLLGLVQTGLVELRTCYETTSVRLHPALIHTHNALPELMQYFLYGNSIFILFLLIFHLVFDAKILTTESLHR